MTSSINGNEIVKAIGKGVANALNTNELFMGIEASTFENTDIHPEYITTVEVAKNLVAIDRRVSLEALMRKLRTQAKFLALINEISNPDARRKIEGKLKKYKFGKKDSYRLDILVQRDDTNTLPLLIAEAKLGSRNLKGITQDVKRIMRIFDMYNELNLLARQSMYGAVVFHTMEEGNGTGVAGHKATSLLNEINKYLSKEKTARPWLRFKSGVIKTNGIANPITAYTEDYPDGTSSEVFAKDCYYFAPGIIILGNAPDIDDVDL